MVFWVFLFAPPASAVSAPGPIQIPFSSNAYGPDGPWHAVTVSFGDPPQTIDLFPASTFASNVLSAKICAGSGNCTDYSAGLFNQSLSSSANDSVAYLPSVSWLAPLGMNGSAKYVMDFMSLPIGYVPFAGMALIDSITVSYSPTLNVPVTLGTFCLGAPAVNQSFPDGNVYINASTPSGYLWQHGFTPSDSFGLHIGSPSLGIPGSLWLGGYDRSRVIGTVLSNAYSYDTTDSEPLWSIDLLDISVFSFQNRSGLLSQANSSLATLDGIAINPSSPFMFLPPSVCAAMTQDLPVEYSPKYGVYLWNTTASNYSSTVKSASYFQFNFRQSSLAVNVPFGLLNLTLERPLAATPTLYFPCYPTSGPYSLGRAFLQAAFFGTDWEPKAPPGNWFLAQAPGPNTGTVPDVHAITKKGGVEASGVQWEDTWEGYWTPIASWSKVNDSDPSSTTTMTTTTGTPMIRPTHADARTTETSSPAQSGFATPGNITAIVLVPLLFLIAVGLAIYFWKRRRRRSSSAAQAISPEQDAMSDKELASDNHPAPREVEGLMVNQLVEASGESHVQQYRHEMEVPSVELPASSPRR